MENTYRIWVWRIDEWELVGSALWADEAFHIAAEWEEAVHAVRVDRCVLFKGTIPEAVS